jgi:hypothetical protein
MTGTDLALQLVITALTHANELTLLIQTARSENRDVSAAELDGLRAKHEVARNALVEAIAKAKAEGR